MYLVTNRNVNEGKKGVDLLADKPNEKGPNELRLIEATRSGANWRLKAMPDILTDEQKQELGLPIEQTCYSSHMAAIKTVARARKEKKHIVFFVHGFNNDVKSVLDRAHKLEKLYNVIVVPFTWPANGGGIHGVASYRDDKRDAYISKGALDRTLEFMHTHLREISEEFQLRLWAQAQEKHPDEAELRDALYTKLLEKACPVTVNLFAHSMGNYVLKQVMKSIAAAGTHLIFDNVLLACADTNNFDHAQWVDNIKCRRRIFVTTNENDNALAASRAKFGQAQLERLGHAVDELNAVRATYVNFTEAAYVKNSHAYFEGTPIKNKHVKQFFQTALTGGPAELPLKYDAAKNLYQVP